MQSAIGTMSDDDTTPASLPVRVLTKAEVNALSAEEKAAYREELKRHCMLPLKLVTMTITIFGILIGSKMSGKGLVESMIGGGL
jgi:hypothetical protein